MFACKMLVPWATRASGRGLLNFCNLYIGSVVPLHPLSKAGTHTSEVMRNSARRVTFAQKLQWLSKCSCVCFVCSSMSFQVKKKTLSSTTTQLRPNKAASLFFQASSSLGYGESLGENQWKILLQTCALS